MLHLVCPSPRVLIVEQRKELGRIMAAMLEMAGLRPWVVGFGSEARRAIRADPPDALVVALLLPDGFGYDVARSLRQVRPDAAVIAFSESFGEDPAVREALQTGLFDLFMQRPFKMARIVSYLEERFGWSRKAPPGDCRTDDPVRDLAASPVRGGSFDLSLDNPEEGLIAAAQAAVEAEHSDEGWLGEAPPEGMTPSLGGLRSGDLSERGVPRLINAFYLSEQTGEMILRQGLAVKMVYFRSGSPVFAASNVQEDRFDVRLRRLGEVPADVLADAIDEARRTGRRMDRVLLDRGVISASRHRTLVAEQVKAILFSLFSWQEGVWELTFHDRAELEPVRLDVHPADLILEGTATLSLEALERLMPSETCLAPSPSPPYELYQLSLSGPQAMVVSRLDGTRSVAEIAEEGWLPEQETYALLYALLCLEVVEDAELLLL